MKTSHGFRLSIIAAAVLAAHGVALADDDIAEFTKPESFVDIGVGNWSGTRHQMGIYDDLGDRGAFFSYDFGLSQRNDANGTWFKLTGSNLGLKGVGEGLNTYEVRADWVRQGDIGGYFERSRLVRINPLTFTTSLAGLGTANPTVDGIVAERRDVRLGTLRDKNEFGFYKAITQTLSFNATLQDEVKEGNRQYGLGSDPYFLVEPVNTETQQIKLALEYTGERLQLAGGYYGSWFSNHNPLILATDTNRAFPGNARNPNQVPLSQPLDNQAHQLFLDGGYSFSATTRASFKVSYSHATQDQSLPTYSLAAPNDRFVNAPSSLNGEVNTTIAQVSVNSRPIPKLSVLASLRYQDMDDATPVAGFVGDNGTGAITVHNTPHSITTTTGKAEATYQLPWRLALTGGIEASTQDRSYPAFENERYVPFRADLDEETYRLQLRRSMTDTLSGSIAYLHSDRDGSDYLATEHFPSDWINPIHIADRSRDKLRVMVNWDPIESLSLQGSVEASKDDYDTTAARPYGLQDGTAERYSLDGAYAINDDWKLTGWYSHDQTEANQLGASIDRVSEQYEYDRAYNLKDKGDSLGFGVRGLVMDRFQVGADLQWTVNKSEYNTVVTDGGIGAALTPAGSEAGAPNTGLTVPRPIENKVVRLALFAETEVQKGSTLRLDFVHERWDTDDWSYQFANGTPFSYGSATADGTTVSTPLKEVSNFVGLRYRVKFM